MKLISLTCPNCGAKLEVDASLGKAYCQYCGAQVLIDEEKRNIKLDNAEETGYQFEKGRQRAQMEARAQESINRRQQQGSFSMPQNNYAYANPQVVVQPQKKRHTVLWVLGWIFFFPIPLTIVIWRSKLPKVAKIILSLLLWGFLISAANSSDEAVEQNVSAPVITAPKRTISKIEKYGFDEATNNIHKEAVYQFSIPDYWVQSDETDYYQAYAETSGKVAMLQIIHEIDTDPVGFYWFEDEAERAAAINNLLMPLNNAEVISEEVYETEYLKGMLWKYTGEMEDLTFGGQVLMFPCEEDNSWIMVNMIVTDNCDYSYDADFEKILANISK